MSLVCVPIYDTLGENAVEYIINHSGATADTADIAQLLGWITSAALFQLLDATGTVTCHVLYVAGAKAVIALGAKVPPLAQAVPKLDHPLLGVAYWGEAPADAVKVGHSKCCCLAAAAAVVAVLVL